MREREKTATKAPGPAYFDGRFRKIEPDPAKWTAWMRRLAGLTPSGQPVNSQIRYLYELSDHTGCYGTVEASSPPDTFFWMVERYKRSNPGEYDFDGLLMFLRAAGIHVRRERRKNPVTVDF